MKIILFLLLSASAFPQISDSVYQYWADKPTYLFDERIRISFTTWQYQQQIEAVIPIPLKDNSDKYQISYTFVIDTTELLRTDNLIYRAVVTGQWTIDTVAYHPILPDGYASFWQRDATGGIIQIRKYELK